MERGLHPTYDALDLDPWVRLQARKILNRAVVRGLIVPSLYCMDCLQQPIRTEAHHLDYLQPLFVLWLCRPCHAARHAQLREEATT